MMAKTKKVMNDKSNKLDTFDMDVDDFLDFSEFDFSPEKEDRKPITSIRKGVVQGLKGTATDKGFIENMIKRALPEGYGQAFNVADSTLGSARELYNKASDDLRGPINEIQRAAARLLPNTKGVVPKKVYEKLEKLTQTSEQFQARSEEQRKQESEASEIGAVIAEVFGTTVQNDDRMFREERAERMVRNQVEDRQYGEQMTQMVTTREGIDRLVAYQDNITSKWHRKSLEVAYKHMFITRDLLGVTNKMGGVSTKLLEAIARNTSLPEQTKVKMSEIQGQMLAQKMIGGVHNAAAEYVRTFGQRFKENIQRAGSDMIRNTLGGVSSGLDMASMASDSGMSREEMAAMTGTMMISEKIGFELADIISRFTDKNQDVKKVGSYLKYHTTALPEAMNKIATTDDGDWSWKGRLKRFGRSLLPSHIQDTELGSSPLLSMDQAEPGGFTSGANRSLIEIIPGFLSRILHMQRVQASGNPNIERIVYNADQGAFTTMGQAVKDASWRMFSPNAQVSTRRALDELIDRIDTTKALNDKQRSALSGQLMRDSVAAKRFDPAEYADANMYSDSIDDKDRQIIAAMFAREFGISSDGKFDSFGNNIAHAADIRQRYSSLKNIIGDPKDMVQGYRNAGQREIMMQLGLIQRQGLNDRINYDVAWDRVRGANTNTDVVDDPVELAERMGVPVEVVVKQQRARASTAGIAQQTSMLEQMIAAANLIAGGIQRANELEESRLNAAAAADTVVEALFSPEPAAVTPRRTASTAGRRPRYTNARKRKGVRYKDRMNVSSPGLPLGEAVSGQRVEEEHAYAGNPVVDKLDEIFASNGELMGLLRQDRQLEMLVEQLGTTIEIRDLLLSGNFGNGDGGGGGAPAQRKGFFGRLFGAGKSALDWGRGQLPRLRKYGGMAWRGAGSIGNMLKGGITNIFGKIAGAALSFGGAALGTAMDALRGARDYITDIRSGDGRLLLEARRMKAGEYFDQATGKVIKSVRDIKGVVVDAAGNIVLSLSDYEGQLFNSQGRRIMLTGARWARALGETGLGALKSPLRAIGRTKDWLLEKIVDRDLKKDIYVKGDLTAPRLYYMKMKQGFYFVADGATGTKLVRSYKDIKGEVMDATGNIVITAEELGRGLVDRNGVPLGSGIFSRLGHKAAAAVGGAVEMGKRLLSMPGRIYRRAKNFLKGAFGGKRGRINTGFEDVHHENLDVQYQQLDTLERIYKLLDDRLPGKKVFGDSDGDGLRDGSWMSRAKKKKEEEEQKKQDAKDANGTGLLAKLFGGGKGLLAKLFGGGKDDDDDEDDDDGGGGTTIIAGGGGDGDGKKKRKPTKGKKGGWRRNRQARKLRKARGAGKAGKGLLGRLGRFKPRGGGLGGIAAGLAMGMGGGWLVDKVGGSDSAAGKAVETTADVAGTATTAWSLASMLGLTGGGAAATGAAATGAAGAGAAGAAAAGAGGAGAAAAGTAGAGLLATVGLPLLIGAAVIGAVGYVGYKAFKKYKYGTYVPVRAFRMAQYGVKYTDASQVEKIVDLEQMLEPHTKQMGGGYDISSSNLKMDEVYKMFDIDDGWFSNNQKERETFDVWFNTRFKPVYLLWYANMKSLGVSTPLNDADDSLDQQKKQDLVRASAKVNPMVYSIKASPFGGDELTMFSEEVDQQFQLALQAIKRDESTTGSAISKMRRVAGASTATIGGVTGMGDVLDGMGEGLQQKRDLAMIKNDPKAQAAIGNLANPYGATGANPYLRNAGGHLTAIAATTAFGAGIPTSIPPLMAVRLKTYGLKSFSPLDVRALLVMENVMAPKIRYGNTTGLATYQGNHQDIFDVVSPMFGISANDAVAKKNWYVWFWVRFLPAFLSFMTEVNKYSQRTNLADLEKSMPAEVQLNAAEACRSATWKNKDKASRPVWIVPEGPFPSSPVNMDIASTNVNMDVLKEQVKTKSISEQGVKATTDSNGVAASAGGLTARIGPDGRPIASAGQGGPTASPSGSSVDSAGLSTFGGSSTPSYTGGAPGASSAGYGGPTLGGNGAPVGQAVAHPGGGTGGDVNSLPKIADGAQGAEALTPLIVAAAKMAGVDPGLMLSMCSIVYGFRPMVGAGTSSARGLYQFINSTWKSMLGKYAGKYGIAPNADQGDAAANALMGAEFLKENAAYLKSKIGRDPTDTELYMAHFMGAGGAVKAIMSDPNQSGPQAMPAAAKANQSIYYEKGGGARTMGGVIAELERRVRTHRYSSRTYTRVKDANPDVGYAAQVNAASAAATANGNPPAAPAATSPTEAKAERAAEVASPASPAGTTAGAAPAREFVDAPRPTSVPAGGTPQPDAPIQETVDPRIQRQQQVTQQAARQEAQAQAAARSNERSSSAMVDTMSKILEVNIAMEKHLRQIAGSTEAVAKMGPGGKVAGTKEEMGRPNPPVNQRAARERSTASAAPPPIDLRRRGTAPA